MMRSVQATLTTLLFTLGAATLFATGALAADGLTVSGEPYYGTDYVQFVVNNEGDKAAFFDLSYNGTDKAVHMVCEPGETPVGWQLAEGETPAGYTLTAYTGRTPGGDASVAVGAGVYADLGGSLVLMATYPAFDAANFTPNGTFYYNGTDYDLVSGDAAACEGGYAYRYTPHLAAVISGSVTYVDNAGAILSTVSLGEIKPEHTAANPLTYQIGASLTLNGATYYPAVTSVSAVYGAQVDFVVPCIKQGFAASDAFQAVIHMVDEAGNTLMTDRVNVSRVYTYALPETFVLTRDGIAASYTYTGVGSVITLRPGDAEGAATKDYTFTYRQTATDSADIGWIIRKVNGVTGAQIGTETIPVKPGETVTYNAANLELDGSTFTAVGGGSYSYTYGGSNLLQTVYYVPAGYQPQGNYDITVQYRNIADGTVLHSETVAATPDADATVTAPATFGDYVRLNGQSDSYSHSYYSPKRTYTIYYRHVNDTLYEDTVITVTQTVTTTRTEYNTITLPPVDGGTTDGGLIDNGTTDLGTVDGGTAGTTGTGTAGGTTGYVAGPTAGQELTAANNDTTGQGNLLTEDGRDTATVRDEIIADNEVPLADAPGEAPTVAPADNETAIDTALPAARTSVWQYMAGGGLGLLGLVLLGLIAWQIIQRRRDRY